MRTVKLNTGVVVTFDKFDNMLSVESPYHKDKKVKQTILERIKNIITL